MVKHYFPSKIGTKARLSKLTTFIQYHSGGFISAIEKEITAYRLERKKYKCLLSQMT